MGADVLPDRAGGHDAIVGGHQRQVWPQESSPRFDRRIYRLLTFIRHVRLSGRNPRLQIYPGCVWGSSHTTVPIRTSVDLQT